MLDPTMSEDAATVRDGLVHGPPYAESDDTTAIQALDRLVALAERAQRAERELAFTADRGDHLVHRDEWEAFDRWQRSTVRADAETVRLAIEFGTYAENPDTETPAALERLVALAESVGRWQERAERFLRRSRRAEAENEKLRDWGREASETLDAIGAYMSSLSDPSPAAAQCDDLTIRFAALAQTGQEGGR